LIGTVADEGGIIHLDGRSLKVPGYEDGNFIGPSVVEGTVTMEAYKCAPVLCYLRPSSKNG
jgi:malonate-semialdehyde dehydrogenase (acetylating)/methylmalonate-semialdehyde dehydrogenase